MSLDRRCLRDLPLQKINREGMHEQVVDQMQELTFN